MTRVDGRVTVHIQCGLVSSHFFLRLRHVMQPVFDLPFGGFVPGEAAVVGFFGGLPGRLFVVALPRAVGLELSGTACRFKSFPSSSSSSTLGTTSSLGERLE